MSIVTYDNKYRIYNNNSNQDNQQLNIPFEFYMYQEHLYKQQLYNTLSNDQGLVDNVKLHLRQKIINKLKTSTFPSKNIQPEKQFLKKLVLSLINQFLSTSRMFHTMAVFAPESGLTKCMLKVQELRQLLKVSQQDQNTSTLQQIIKSILPKGRLTSTTTSTAIQTDDKQTIQNLQNKLSHIEFQFKQKAIQGLKSVQDSQQRFLNYKNELNKRYKDELDQQIKRIRDFQIAKVRMDQQQKLRIRMRDYEEELQLSYQSKLEKLREKQAEVMTRVANKMKQVQTYNYQMRQNILRDFQSIKAKQEELQRLKNQLLDQQRKNA